MNDYLKVFILICGLIFSYVIMRMLVKKRINERNSLLWLFSITVILVLSFIPELLKVLADIVGIDYPPSLLFLFSILILFLIVFNQSIQISVLNAQLKELTQNIAIKQLEKPDEKRCTE